MKESVQDRVYLEEEGDAFFSRNIKDRDLPPLRDAKRVIRDHLGESAIPFKRVLEYGCNYGDLLFHLREQGGAEECVGVEASSQAVEFGQSRYGETVKLVQGTIAANSINDSGDYNNHFDLIIIDDVFGWVSRETLLTSIANIDALLADGGYVFIRDFYPDKRTRVRNHHVSGDRVFNYKIPGSHAAIFEATGMYEAEWQKVYYDNIGMSTGFKSDNRFIYRWTDVVLKKAYADYFHMD